MGSAISDFGEQREDAVRLWIDSVPVPGLPERGDEESTSLQPPRGVRLHLRLHWATSPLSAPIVSSVHDRMRQKLDPGKRSGHWGQNSMWSCWLASGLEVWERFVQNSSGPSFDPVDQRQDHKKIVQGCKIRSWGGLNLSVRNFLNWQTSRHHSCDQSQHETN